MRFVADLPDYLGRGGPYLHDLAIERDARRRAPDAVASRMVLAGRSGRRSATRARRNCSPTTCATARFRYRALDADSTLGEWQDKWDDRRPRCRCRCEVTLQRCRRPRLAAAGGRLAAGAAAPAPRGDRSRERVAIARIRGAALLLVLWLIALLTALIGAFALTARIEHLQGRVLQPRRGRRRSRARRAGIRADPRRRHRSAPPLAARRPRLPLAVSAMPQSRSASIDENGKVDLNQADATVLAALFRRRSASTQRQADAPGRARSSTGATPDTAHPARRAAPKTPTTRPRDRPMAPRTRRSKAWPNSSRCWA